MSYESTFGNGSLGLNHFGPQSEAFSWEEYAMLIGKYNGCPRVITNIEKELVKLGDFGTREKAAESYARKHAPNNFWWRFLLETAKIENPTLAQNMEQSWELVPDGDIYDPECVDQNYRVGRRFGLAQDSAYAITTNMLQVLRHPVVRGYPNRTSTMLFGNPDDSRDPGMLNLLLQANTLQEMFAVSKTFI